MQQPFVGRTHEREVVGGLLDAARSGLPRPLVISGSAGCGKSAMLRYTVVLAQEQGFRTIVTEADVVDGSAPFAAIRRWLVGLEAVDGAFETPHVVERIATLSELVRTDGGNSQRSRRSKIAEAFLDVLRTWAGRAPVLVAIDDLHAADPATAQLMTYVMRHVEPSRILAVATTRPHPELDAAASDELGRLRDRGEAKHIELSGFDDGELVSYIEARFAATPRPFLLDVIRERTDGLPFFVAELLTAMEDAGALIIDGAEVDAVTSARETLPSRVQTAVLHQAARLDRDARRVAAAAALLGEVRLARLPWLGALAELPPARRDEAFDQLVRARLLIEESDRFRFRHAMVREALYGDIGPATRRRWHAQVAALLREQRTAAEPEIILEIGEHLRRAGGGQDVRAAGLLLEAGDWTVNAEPVAAIGWYREALARLPLDHILVTKTQLKLSRALDLAGRHREASRVAMAALHVLPPGHGRAGAAIIAARARSSCGDLDGAGQVLDAALADDNTRTSALVLNRGLVHLAAEEEPAAAACLAQAMTMKPPAEQTAADVLQMHLDVRAGRFAPAAARAEMFRRQLVAASAGAQARLRFASSLVTAYNFDPAIALAEIDDAPNDGPRSSWFDAIAALALFRQGQLIEAITRADAALVGMARERGDLLNGVSLFVLIEARTLVGDLEGARHGCNLAEGMQHLTTRALVDAATARMLAANGQSADALDLLSAATERAGGQVNMLADVLAHTVDVCAELGSTEARTANRRLQALEHDGAGVAHTMRLLLAHAVAERDLDAARAARTHALGFGLALDAARALALCGSIGDDPEAIVDAFHEVERLGAGHYRREFAAELRRLGRRAPSRNRRPAELSAIEIDLVAFLAQGLTNRQIARRMYLSPKTVEVYLSRIYSKTGRRSRVELAMAFQDGTVGSNG